jgi:hypothetical protein
MAKDNPEGLASNTDQATPTNKTTLLDLQTDANLWYKVHVLIYDLCYIKSDRASESRTLCTTDELYISGPYFTPSEAAMVKGAVLEPSRKPEETTDTDDSPKLESLTLKREPKTVEESIKERLAGFFDKRRVSGDSRPCGPHDMVPIYESVFNIKHSELEDAQFLSRLRRSGLGDSTEKEKETLKKEKKGKKSRRS